MGASATPWHVRLCLTALTDALAAQNYPDASRAALAAADAKLG
jgi:alanine-glyoxylate transaminase/serine-glyoxylate transaminase/serine-pyruvate transaminase